MDRSKTAHLVPKIYNLLTLAFGIEVQFTTKKTKWCFNHLTRLLGVNMQIRIQKLQAHVHLCTGMYDCMNDNKDVPK